MKLLIRIVFISLLLKGTSFSQWKPSNGPYGGVIKALAVCSTGTGVNLFAGTNKGIFRSTNNGIHWSAVNNGLLNLSITSLVVTGGNIFAGTEYSGVFLSTNQGETWIEINNGLTCPIIISLAVSDDNGGASAVYAGTYEGLYRTTNSGLNWIPAGLGTEYITTITTSGTNLYAGWFYPDPGYVGGISLSTNNGATWNSISNGLPNNTYVYSIVLLPGSDGGTKIMAATWRGIYLSTDNGENWILTNNALSDFCITALSLFNSESFLIAGTYGSGLFLSTDYGTTWSSVSNGLTNQIILSITFSPQEIFVGTDGGGVNVSSNYGQSWNSVSTNLPGTFVFSIISPQGSNTSDVYAGTYDAGVFYSSNNGLSWDDISNGLTFTQINVLAHLENKLYAGTDSGIYRSTNNGIVWTKVNNGLTNKSTWSFAASPDGGNLFAGTQGGVFLSIDGGVNWVNKGLNGKNVRALIYSGKDLFAGTRASWPTDSGGVFISTDNGNSWKGINNNLPSYNTVNCFSLSGNDIFAGGYGVYLTTNKGSEWTQLNSGTSTNSIAISDSVLFIGDSFDGVSVSTNYGGNWIECNQGLPYSHIRSLLISNDTIFAGTWEGGVWKRALSEMITTVSDITSPRHFFLGQNYPNPFNPSTNIIYYVPQHSNVVLNVFDILGNEIETIVNEVKHTGQYKVTWNAAYLPSGVYFYQLKAGSFVETKKMILMR